MGFLLLGLAGQSHPSSHISPPLVFRWDTHIEYQHIIVTEMCEWDGGALPTALCQMDPIPNPRGSPNSLSVQQNSTPGWDFSYWQPQQRAVCPHLPTLCGAHCHFEQHWWWRINQGHQRVSAGWGNAQLGPYPPLTTLSTPDQCDSGDSPTWKGPG